MKLNLLVHSVKGLGRGRGFQVTSVKSIVADPEYLGVRKQLAARMIEVLGLLVRDGTISNNVILQQLGISDDSKAKMARMGDDIRAKLANVEELKGVQSLTIKVLTKELDESKAKVARMEEEKRAQPVSLLSKSQSNDIITKVSRLEEENRNLVFELRSIEDEKREVEAQYASIEREVDLLLLSAGLRPSQYRDLDARFEALGDELRAVRASRE